MASLPALRAVPQREVSARRSCSDLHGVRKEAIDHVIDGPPAAPFSPRVGCVLGVRRTLVSASIDKSARAANSSPVIEQSCLHLELTA